METDGSLQQENLWDDYDSLIAEDDLLKLFSEAAGDDDDHNTGSVLYCLSHNSSNRLTARQGSHPFADLPSELVVMILSMLPVKTLIQSTTVCKQWYAIIKDPNFISSHLSRSISDASRHALLVTPMQLCRLPNNRELAVFHDSNGSLTHQYNLGIPFETHTRTIEIIGSCNGVLCITDWTGVMGSGLDIFLLNPSINKYKKLSGELSSFGNLFKKMDEEDYFTAVNGFGYCESKDDYIVVRIIRFKDPTLEHLVEVFSLKTGMWKSIKASVDIKFRDGIRHALVDGCLYWLAYRRPEEPTIFLQSFDLKDEVFRKIELPSHVDPLAVNNVIEISGSVGVCTMVPIDGTPPILRTNLWVMERNSCGRVQWKALNYLDVEWKDFKYRYIEECGISPFRALGFSANGKLIVEETSRKRCMPIIIALDIHNSGAVERLTAEGFVTADPCYVESLVLLGE